MQLTRIISKGMSMPLQRVTQESLLAWTGCAIVLIAAGPMETLDSELTSTILIVAYFSAARTW